jgi:hypothetical protein
MGAESTSNLTSVAFKKANPSNGISHCKQDQGVTPISKKTRRDRDRSVQSYHHVTKFSHIKTPIGSANNNNTVEVNRGRNASHEYSINSLDPYSHKSLKR